MGEGWREDGEDKVQRLGKDGYGEKDSEWEKGRGEQMKIWGQKDENEGKD